VAYEEQQEDGEGSPSQRLTLRLPGARLQGRGSEVMRRTTLKLIESNPDTALAGGLIVAGAGLSAAFGLAGPKSFQVSVLPLASAALVQVFRRSAEVGTRALGLRVCGSAFGLAPLLQRAALSACTHQGQGGTVSPRRVYPAFRGLGGK
jgi:hypothetical protein